MLAGRPEPINQDRANEESFCSVPLFVCFARSLFFMCIEVVSRAPVTFRPPAAVYVSYLPSSPASRNCYPDTELIAIFAFCSARRKLSPSLYTELFEIFAFCSVLFPRFIQNKISNCVFVLYLQSVSYRFIQNFFQFYGVRSVQRLKRSRTFCDFCDLFCMAD